MRFPLAARALVSLSALAGVVTLLIDTGGSLNSFVYFTVQSNLFVAVVFGLAAVQRATVVWRGAATLYIAITGTVYHLVLVNPASPFHMVDPGAGTLHNFLLHTATPALAALDWLILNRDRVRWQFALIWLGYPLAYLAFALVRGLFVHAYPYPFIDANKLGYGGVAISTLVFAVLFFLLGLLLIGLGALSLRLRERRA